MDAVRLELQIQLWKPLKHLFRGDNLAWLGLELGTYLVTPRALLEALVHIVRRGLPCPGFDHTLVPRAAVAGRASPMMGVGISKVSKGISRSETLRPASNHGTSRFSQTATSQTITPS
jgi:hypothetical protein